MSARVDATFLRGMRVFEDGAGDRQAARRIPAPADADVNASAGDSQRRHARAAACRPARPRLPVAIVGAGACGLTAALMLRDAGVDCVLLERDARAAGLDRAVLGLHSRRRHARAARGRRADDSAERFAADIQAKAHGTAAPHLVAAYTAGHRAGAGRAAAAPRPASSSCSTAFSTPATACGACTPCRSAPARRWWRRSKPPPRAPARMLLTRRAGARAVVRRRRARARRRLSSGPTARIEHLACRALLLACNGFGGNPAMVRELLPEMRDAVFAGHAGNDGSAIAWGRQLGARPGRPGRLPGPRLLGGAAGRADLLGADDGRRRAGQCRRASASTTRPPATPKPSVQVLAQPGGVAWNVFDDAPARARPHASRTSCAAEAAGAVRHGRRRRRAGRVDRLRRARARCGAPTLGRHRALAAAVLRDQGHRRAVPHPGRAGHRRAVPRAARRRHALAQPAGRRRRGARRLGQRGVGLPVGQRPAQRGGRRLHRGAHRGAAAGRRAR